MSAYSFKVAYIEGFKKAAQEIQAGNASYTQARERGLYPNSLDHRIEWDYGYEECVTAYRLGHDIQQMVRKEFYSVSFLFTDIVIQKLLDGAWEAPIRPDPRK